MIKQIYSARKGRKVWMYDTWLGDRRVRESGFPTKKAAMEAMEDLISKVRDERRALRASEIATSQVIEKAIIGPLKRENERLRRENEEYKRAAKMAAEGLTLISLTRASEITGIPVPRLRSAIKEGHMPGTRLGRGMKVRLKDYVNIRRMFITLAQCLRNSLRPDLARHRHSKKASGTPGSNQGMPPPRSEGEGVG